MANDGFKASDDPNKVIEAMLNGKSRDDMGDMRRERRALPGERALDEASDKIGDLADSAENWLDRKIDDIFNYFSDQEASDAEARQDIAEEFITAVKNGDVSPELFEAAQQVHNEGINALSHQTARDSLSFDFKDSYYELLNTPKEFGLTGPMSPEGRLYMDHTENGQVYYKLTEFNGEGEPAVADITVNHDNINSI